MSPVPSSACFHFHKERVEVGNLKVKVRGSDSHWLENDIEALRVEFMQWIWIIISAESYGWMDDLVLKL